MESGQAIASVPTQGQVPAVPQRAHPAAGSVVLRILSIIVFGALIGIAGSVWEMWVPGNRIVVYDQSPSMYVLVRSVHITKPSYISLSVYANEGWGEVGDSGYLPAGYYRNLVIPLRADYAEAFTRIDESSGDPIPRSHRFFARIYQATNKEDVLFDPSTTIPVVDRTGLPYTKHFYMTYNANAVKEMLKEFAENPFDYLRDQLFP
jgi:hypothetical protein